MNGTPGPSATEVSEASHASEASETLAFVESPVQLLNVLEWAHAQADPQRHGLTVVVLSPTDPMTRGQMRRMAELARHEGMRVRWEEARGGAGAPFQTIGGLASALRRARRDRHRRPVLAVRAAAADDHARPGPGRRRRRHGHHGVHRPAHRRRATWSAGTGAAAAGRRATSSSGRFRRRRAAASPRRPPAPSRSSPRCPWSGPRGSPSPPTASAGPGPASGRPVVSRGADLVGTSLVETGVVDPDRYVEAVSALARTHGATRYFAHRRESTDKLHRLAVETGLGDVRPDLPLELIARRGPIGRTILSFPSTVVHTLPLALAGTGVRVAVCDVNPQWLQDTASPRAQGFLSGVTTTARDVQRLPALG